MPKISYVSKRFHPGTVALIDASDEVLRDCTEAGYQITLRQLFYRLVVRGDIGNSALDYKRLGSVVTDARRAGLLDWTSIGGAPTAVPRPRNRPPSLIIWLSTESLAGVIAPFVGAGAVLVPCRGYAPDPEVWKLARWIARGADGDPCTVFHLDDFDATGIDTTRDVTERLALFGADNATVVRGALTAEQIKALNPPPKPGTTDEWELDALHPSELVGLLPEKCLDASTRDRAGSGTKGGK